MPRKCRVVFSLLGHAVGMSQDAKLAEINARLNESLTKSLGG